MDERISLSSDPMDPDLSFPPFQIMGNWMDVSSMIGNAYHAAQWVTHGILTQLGYPRLYGIRALNQSTGLPIQGAFRMSGGQTSIDEMIATTKRGVLVTRFTDVAKLDFKSELCRGYTRDGVWLIENGKISKPVKNMVFTESILFALNKVDQLGVPQRVFHPKESWWWHTPKPVIVPPLKISDFNFSALSDAV
jgi:predicted Zn-dependent protease